MFHIRLIFPYTFQDLAVLVLESKIDDKSKEKFEMMSGIMSSC